MWWWTGVALAALPSVSDQGFVVEHRVELPLAPEQAWERLVDVASWWHPEHTWGGRAEGMRLEPVAGGCLCEDLPEGSVQHLQVVYAHPGRLLRLRGALGPLQSMALTGAMSFALEPREAGGSALSLRYAVAGWHPDGLTELAGAVDAVLGMQLERYAQLDGAEGGAP